VTWDQREKRGVLRVFLWKETGQLRINHQPEVDEENNELKDYCMFDGL
jgi:hypothetical protein